MTEQRYAKEEAFEAIFPLGISFKVENLHWPPFGPLETPSSTPTFSLEGANSLCRAGMQDAV